jgi:uncharacterized membrane protein
LIRFLAIVFALLVAVPAQAALTVCNKAKRPARVALGRYSGTEWKSEGWWTLAPKTCGVVVKGSLQARYYYLYATDGGAGTWGGDHGFCIAGAGRFEIPGRDGCAARGYDRKGFFEVDTGNLTDATQSLSD